MASLKSSRQTRAALPDLYDPIRKVWVKGDPEEVIRQALIERLVHELDFSPLLLGIEKELASLPHIRLTSHDQIPKRRLDIIAYARGIHKNFSFYPLIVIECKAVPITPKVVGQVVGYNHFIKAPFVAVANGEKIVTGAFDSAQGHYHFEEGIDSYAKLVSKASK